MKKQITVTKNFQKNIEQWKISQERKLQNLLNQKKLLKIKAERCSQQIDLIDKVIEEIQNAVPPSPPSIETRSQQFERMRALHPDASDETVQALVDNNIWPNS